MRCRACFVLGALLALIGRVAAGDIDEQRHAVFAATTIGAVVVICFWVYGWMHIPFFAKWVPECVVTVSLGALVAAVYVVVQQAGGGQSATLERFLNLDEEIFQLLLLPLCLLESGFGLKKDHFFGNIGAILLFAVVGTLLSTVICALGFMGISALGWVPSLDPLEALSYGSVISAVDPVATLAALASVGAPDMLFTLIFGESVLNDAVSLVLFESISHMAKYDGVTTKSVLSAVWFFIYSFTGSIALGVASGLVAAFISSRSSLDRVPMLEVLLILSASFLPYMLSEALGLSGITSILFAGIVVSRYALDNCSTASQATVHGILRLLAYIADNVIFFYLGTSLFTGAMAKFNPVLTLCTLLFIVLGRAVNIFGLSSLINLTRSPERQISGKYQFVSFWGGLRGAVAFVLARMMIWHSDLWTSTTIVIVLFTVGVFGTSTEPIVKRFGLSQKKSTGEHGEVNPMLLADASEDRPAAGSQPTAPEDDAKPCAGVLASVQITDTGAVNLNLHRSRQSDQTRFQRWEGKLGNFLRRTRVGRRSVREQDVVDMAVLIGISAEMRAEAEAEAQEGNSELLAEHI